MKNNFQFSTLHFQLKKSGFTLAEVLITLGIIGVVSAITIPILIQKHNNSTVETRLKKIYSIMNQAILASEAEYGEKENWDFADENFWDKYFAKYVKVIKTERIKNDKYTYNKHYLPDGSLLVVKYMQIKKDEDDNEIETINTAVGSNSDYYFYPNAKNFNLETFSDFSETGKTGFYFRFAPASNAPSDKYHTGKGFEPYLNAWDGELETLSTGSPYNYSCEAGAMGLYCTKLIQLNGWKIPNNYPHKVK